MTRQNPATHMCPTDDGRKSIARCGLYGQKSSNSPPRTLPSRPKPSLAAKERDHLVAPLPRLHVRKGERPRLAHARGVGRHHFERGADVRGEVDLVDHEQVGARDAGAALARDFLAARDVDDIDRDVGEFGRERRCEIVAARFDQDEVEIAKPLSHLVDRGQIDRGVFADRGMRAAAGLDAHDAVGIERARLDENARVLLRIDVVGDRGDFELAAQALAELLHQRGLAGADGAADADPQRLFRWAHVRNNLEYWVSCRRAARSERKVQPPNASRSAPAHSPAIAARRGRSAARTRCPSVWPIALRRTAAETRFAKTATTKAGSADSSRKPWPADAAPTATA